MKNLKRGSASASLVRDGFTLIELLVVIAIIGILSSVVLASLNTARNKGKDTAVKSNLANARAEAEMFYDTSSSYDGVCANTTAANVIGDSVDAAAKATGGSYAAGDTIVDTASVAACHDSSSGWAAVAPLKAGGGYCVDSTGASIAVATGSLASGEVSCN